ncbi:MAG: CAP domain-containing protein [Fimbriimonas sp.]
MLATIFAVTLSMGFQAPPPNPPAAVAEVSRLTNAAREKEGRLPLRLNDALTKAAQAHADDMAARGYFSHEGQDGSDMSDRVERIGYRYRGLAENIAMGQRTPKEVVAGWLKSSGHRTNILNGEYRDLGVGTAKDKRGVIRWVQVFGTPR